MSRPITNRLDWLRGKRWIKWAVPKHMYLVCPACKSKRTSKFPNKPFRYCLDCKNQFDWGIYYIETIRG